MPTFLRMPPSFRSGRCVISSPSTQTSPEVGLKSPMKCLSSTLFPLPERPRTTHVSPVCDLQIDAAQHLLLAERLGKLPDGDHARLRAVREKHVEQEGQEEIQNEDG